MAEDDLERKSGNAKRSMQLIDLRKPVRGSHDRGNSQINRDKKITSDDTTAFSIPVG